MPATDPDTRPRAMALFELGRKASAAGIHRTLSRAPKGKGWVRCVDTPDGMMCRPAKVRDAVEHFTRAYAVFPDIVFLLQIVLPHEMPGERNAARECFARLREQTLADSDASYRAAADRGLARTT